MTTAVQGTDAAVVISVSIIQHHQPCSSSSNSDCGRPSPDCTDEHRDASFFVTIATSRYRSSLRKFSSCRARIFVAGHRVSRPDTAAAVNFESLQTHARDTTTNLIMGKISNVTNNTDPDSVRSRVFVGNLNTTALTKDDVRAIFERYGDVVAVSTHRGYAFVQYATDSSARNAVAGEDQRVYAGQEIG